MRAEKIIRLRMQNSTFCRRIPVVQGDTARTFRFILEDITLDGTEHARIYARKPSGAEIYDECDVIGSNEVIFTPETEQIFIETGIIPAEIRVAKGEKLITSYSFEFEVRQSAMRTGDIPSSDEFNALERAIEEAKGLHEPEFTEAGKRENIVSGETMQILFGKIKKWFTDMGALIIKIGNKDISSIGDGTVTGAITDLDKRNTKNTSDIDIERKRIDNIAKLPEGATTGDAELADIRVAADGTSYDTAGEAVRGQINQIDQKYEKETSSLNKKTVQLEKIVEALQESIGLIYGNIVVSKTTISMDEGTSTAFTVNLDKAPSENQTIDITIEGNYVTVSPSVLTFTPDNYNVAQTVTVSSVDDDDEGDKQEIITLTSTYKMAQINITIVNDDISIEWYTVTTDDVRGINASNYLLQNYTGNEINVLIPKTLNEKTVQMAVAMNSNFDQNNVIENIKFEDGVGGSFVNGSSHLTALKSVYGIGSLSTFNISSNTLEKVIITSDNANCTSFSVSNTKSLKRITGLEHLIALENGERALKGAQLEKIEKYPPNLKNTKLMFWQCNQLKSVPDIYMELETWDNMFLGCNALKEISVSAMVGCDLTLIGYNTSNGTGWTGEDLTFKCYYGSDMYNSFRNMICDSVGSSEKLYIETLDPIKNPITNIVMWGDSMTKAGNKTMGNMPDQLAGLVSNNVMIWNYGYSGNTIGSCGTRFKNHPEKWGEVSVIWLGTNNTSYSGEQMVSEIKETFINNLTTDKYIVVGLLTTNYSDEKNQTFIDGFGDHFLNIRDYFLKNMWTISGLTATEQDNTDLTNGLVPTSFRYDVTHLNPNGGKVVATAIKEKLTTLGYIAGT